MWASWLFYLVWLLCAKLFIIHYWDVVKRFNQIIKCRIISVSNCNDKKKICNYINQNTILGAYISLGSGHCARDSPGVSAQIPGEIKLWNYICFIWGYTIDLFMLIILYVQKVYWHSRKNILYSCIRKWGLHPLLTITIL